MICYLLLIFRIIKLNSTDHFFKVYTSSGGDEGQSYVVNGLRRLQEDVCAELIVVDNIRSVVGAIANNQEPVESSLRLKITEIWIDDVSEVCSCQFIVQFKELCFCCLLQCLLNSKEQATNVNSVECRCIT